MAWLAVVLCALLLPGAIRARHTCSVDTEDYANNKAVQLFRQYLQLNTTTYNDLSGAVAFWEKQAKAVGLEFNKYEFTEGFPVLVMRYPGLNSSLGSIMLNSHMDVVPADENEGWTYPPFSAYLDADGVIWGRGSQDDKGMSIQYFEALKWMKANNIQPLRDVYMTLMPDEEVGAPNGMQLFLKSDKFAAMNVGFELDEGGAYDLPYIPVFYQDKVVWQIQVDCYAPSGHSSIFTEANDTAVGKCYDVMTNMYELRETEYLKSVEAGLFDAGAYSSVNLNIIRAGTANNVVPGQATLVYDIRLETTLDEDTFDAQLRELILGADDGVNMTYISKDPQSPATVITSANPYWVTFANVTSNLNLTVLPIVPPASSDARHVRSAGYPALGFSPMPNTELLAHSVDERVGVDTFLKGIDIYKALIPALANISGSLTSTDPSIYNLPTIAPQGR